MANGSNQNYAIDILRKVAQIMSVIIPDCTSCKHLRDEKVNNVFCCSAFPNGIPKEYFWGSIDVRSLSKCNNSIKFEEDKD